MLLFPCWKEICSTSLHNAIALERSLILNLWERKVMRGMDLIEVARQCPDLTVSIRLGDLIEANQNLVEEALMRLEKSVAESRTEIYLSRTKVMEMLEVASATLWRWEKCGYLIPLSVGGKKRYRLSDIQRLLNRWCFIQQRDEKGKAQESIGSWAFPAFIRGHALFIGITIPDVVIWCCGNA